MCFNGAGFAFGDELPLLPKTPIRNSAGSVPLDCNPKELRSGFNPVSSFGSQTLTLDNFGLQIRNDRRKKEQKLLHSESPVRLFFLVDNTALSHPARHSLLCYSRLTAGGIVDLLNKFVST